VYSSATVTLCPGETERDGEPSNPPTMRTRSTTVSTDFTHRHLALLRAVDAGRCELTCSCEPDLFIDGRTCCDQTAAHLLAREGLIRHATQGPIGQRVPAQLTDAGRAVLYSVTPLSDVTGPGPTPLADAA
jgi:hypothetical protein